MGPRIRKIKIFDKVYWRVETLNGYSGFGSFSSKEAAEKRFIEVFGYAYKWGK